MPNVKIALLILLFMMASDAKAQRIFSEQDFIFDKNTEKHKQIIIKRVASIHNKIPFCAIIDPSSTYLSKELSTAKIPIFFVTCGTGTSARNVFFSETEIWMKRSDVVLEKSQTPNTN